MRRQEVHSVLLIGIIVVGFALAGYSAVLLWKFRDIAPYGTMVDIVRWLDRMPNLRLGDLFSIKDFEHNLPFYLYWIDHSRYGASGAFLFPVLYGGTALLALACASWAWRNGLSRMERAAVVGLSAASFFWLGHFENLLWEKQVDKLLALLFAVVACGCASAVPAKSAEGPAARDVVVAGIAGLLATCAADSYLIGVAAFPVILGHAFFARWRPAALLSFAAFVPLALVPYALSLPADFLTGQPWAALAHSWRSIAYVARILLPPLNLVFYGPSLSFGIAALCVIALVLLGWVAKRRYGKPEWRSRSDLWSLDFCLLMAGLAASSAFIVGFAYPAVHPGLDSQNAVIGAIFGMACVGVAVTVKEPAARRRMLALSSLFVLLLLVGFTPALEQAVRNRATLLVNAGVTATLGDDIPNRNLHPKRALVAEIWTKARDPYPSFRDRMPFYWIGRSVDELPRRPADAGCLGNLEWYRYVSTFAAFAVGWGFAQLYTPGIEWIVLANQRGEIVGAGRPAKLRRDIELEHREDNGRGSRRAMQYSGFEATFRLGRGLALSLWLIDARGQACQVGEPMKVEDLP